MMAIRCFICCRLADDTDERRCGDGSVKVKGEVPPNNGCVSKCVYFHLIVKGMP